MANIGKYMEMETSVFFEFLKGHLTYLFSNGVGRQRSQQMHRQAAHTPAGLSITNERINLLNEIYGANISLNITDRIEADGTPAGTIVRLTLPLGLNKKA